MEPTFSTRDAGQDFVVLVGMVLSNVTAELGAQLLKTGNESVPKTHRIPRVARHFHDMAPPPTSAPSPVVEEVATNKAAQSEEVAVLFKQAFEKHPEWQVNGDQVFCPNGPQMRLHRQKPTDCGTTSGSAAQFQEALPA